MPTCRRCLAGAPRPRRGLSLRALFAALLAVGIVAAAAVVSRGADPDAAAIDKLIQQLGSDDAAQRQAAAKKLDEIGEPALDALRKAAASASDVDLRLRASVVAGAIEKKLYGEVRRFTGHTGTPGNVAVSKDGKFALSGGDGSDPLVRLWDLDSGKEVKNFKGHSGIVQNLSFSPDGKRFLSCGRDGTVRLWDIESGKELKRLADKGMIGEVWDVNFSPDGAQAVGAGQDGVVRVWDVDSGMVLKRFEGQKATFVKSAVFSPDGKQVLSAGPDVRLWEVESGKEVYKMVHGTDVREAVFAPDGKRAASGGADGVIVVWDLTTGKEERRLKGHTGIVHGLAFTPDGKRLVSGAYDQTLRVWDVEKGEEVFRYSTDGHNVNWTALTPEGDKALISVFDKTLRLIKLPPAKKGA